MFVHATAIVGLKCSFHCFIYLILFIIYRFGVQNYSYFSKYQRNMLNLIESFMIFSKIIVPLQRF